jgi:hypothetical protein
MTADELWKARLEKDRSDARAAIAQRGMLSVLSLPTLQVFMCSHLSAQLTQWLSIAPCTAACYNDQHDHVRLNCPPLQMITSSLSRTKSPAFRQGDSLS